MIMEENADYCSMKHQDTDQQDNEEDIYAKIDAMRK